MRPSSAQRRRARSPRLFLKKPSKPKLSKAERKAKKRLRQKNAVTAEAKDLAVTERLVAELASAEHLPNPDDLLGRLSTILFEVGVLESARRGLLGDLKKMVLCGDGSPLRTGANGQGQRLCSHGKREKCDCPRRYADGDAAWGYDSYREQYFFGHHFYELLVSSGGHDLPLHVRLDPGNETDFTASLRALSHLKKTLRTQKLDWRIFAGVFDCGHDSEATARYLVERDIAPIIPLRTPAPAIHPQRPELALSPRGVPQCQAGAEMVPWGSAGKTHKVFICPVNAGVLEHCPLAPESEPEWRCRPELKVGPVVNLKVGQNPRLCPPIPRNSPKYEEMYRLRSGCERSNGVKKETFKLEGARHRRASFWQCRLNLMGLLQHAKAWVCEESAAELVLHLLGESAAQAA